MRTLSATLEAAQKSPFVNSLVKIVLTYDVYTYTYTKPRILDIKETEDGSLQSFEILLDNSDGILTELDLQGYQAALSFGVATTAGDEYSACAPMSVMAQKFSSDPNDLTCTLTVVGICNLMSQDEASEKYMPDEDDTKTVKTLVDEIIGATLTCFDHCTAYPVEWDAGYDTLADTYKPKDEFRVYVGNNRMSAINRLLDFTLNVAVAKNDGKVHIFKPTTSGETYDYQYSLDSGQHQFFSKALRNRLVTPNYIKVQSREDDDPQYSGTATDAESFARLPKAHFKHTYLESDAQATAIAEAIQAKAKMWCEAGAANVPMNVGAEAFDYVKVTDPREGDYRVGNIGKITRRYNVTKNEWSMSFLFGNWQNVRKVLAHLNITGDDIENYFARLSVGDLYVENILAENVDFVWIDPEGNIDLDKIGDTLDNLPDGEVYARVKTLHLDAGLIKLDEYILYASGYNPLEKFDLNLNDLDDIPDGSVFQRAKSLALTAAGMVILDQVVVGTYGLVYSADISAHHILLSKTIKDGDWYQESGVGIDATKGIGLYGGEGLMGLRSYPTLADYEADINVQCYVGTDGKLYGGGGAAWIDEEGVNIKGEHLLFKDGAGNNVATIQGYTGKILYLWLGDYETEVVDGTLHINCKDIVCELYSGYSLRPFSSGVGSLGSPSKQWRGGYFSTRLKIPVGTDLYD